MAVVEYFEVLIITCLERQRKSRKASVKIAICGSKIEPMSSQV